MFGRKKKEEQELKVVAKEMPDISQDSYDDFARDEHLTPEEAQAKIAMLMAKTENPEILSELNEEEIAVLASLKTLADKYNMPLIKGFIKNFLLLRVSHKRQGRNEIKEIARGGERHEDKMRRGLKQMVLGLR